jgi:uncharacterized protein with GYD domain
MPYYMYQGSYTSETWARLSKTPENREAIVREIVEKNGGKLHSLFFTFGADDFVAIAELSDNTNAAALAVAVAGTGGYRNFRTTPLLTAQEGMEAMRQAGQTGFRPAGSGR